jgi:hypothetical protein
MQQLETGTGGACAPLSEILPAARVARFVRMTEGALAVLEMSRNLTPNPFPRGKGNQKKSSERDAVLSPWPPFQMERGNANLTPNPFFGPITRRGTGFEKELS